MPLVDAKPPQPTSRTRPTGCASIFQTNHTSGPCTTRKKLSVRHVPIYPPVPLMRWLVFIYHLGPADREQPNAPCDRIAGGGGGQATTVLSDAKARGCGCPHGSTFRSASVSFPRKYPGHRAGGPSGGCRTSSIGTSWIEAVTSPPGNSPNCSCRSCATASGWFGRRLLLQSLGDHQLGDFLIVVAEDVPEHLVDVAAE